jgi:shikimate kinase
LTLASRIALVGFMGAGKTTVGRALARRLGYRFADSDHAVEAKTGRTVRDVFAEEGEAAFRRLEREAIDTLLREAGVVIATGGGAFVEPETALLLREKAIVVHLDCGLQEALRRAEKSGGRPLLDAGPEAVAALFAARKDKYAQAHIEISTTRRAPADVVSEILKSLPPR